MYAIRMMALVKQPRAHNVIIAPVNPRTRSSGSGSFAWEVPRLFCDISPFICMLTHYQHQDKMCSVKCSQDLVAL